MIIEVNVEKKSDLRSYTKDCYYLIKYSSNEDAVVLCLQNNMADFSEGYSHYKHSGHFFILGHFFDQNKMYAAGDTYVSWQPQENSGDGVRSYLVSKYIPVETEGKTVLRWVKFPQEEYNAWIKDLKDEHYAKIKRKKIKDPTEGKSFTEHFENWKKKMLEHDNDDKKKGKQEKLKKLLTPSYDFGDAISAVFVVILLGIIVVFAVCAIIAGIFLSLMLTIIPWALGLSHIFNTFFGS